MASNVIHGKDCVVGYYSSSTFVAIGASKSCTLNVSVDTQEVASSTSGTWNEYVLKRSGWTMSVSGLLVSGDTDLFDMLAARTALSVSFTGTGIEYTGSAYLTDVSYTATIKDLTEYSISLQGTGELTNSSSTDVD